MIYGSVCSGIEAATVAWHPLGWTPAFLSEIDKFPRAVLNHRCPDVPLHGDFTTIGNDEYGSIDLLVGGTPCQSFSIAGLRKGMDDDRGNLALEYLKLAQRKRPTWLVWENVPGVLSSNGGRDFGAFLGGLVQLGYRYAYRVLDAQYFGVPQRRRRVFVIGYLGDWRPAAAVLFERHSLQGHPAPGREKREEVAGILTTGLERRRGSGQQPETLVADVSAPMTRNPYGDNESRESLLVARMRGFGDYEFNGPISPMLSRDHRDHKDLVIAFSCKDDGPGAAQNLSPTLRAMGDARANGGGQMAVAFAQNSRDELREMEVAGALSANPGMKQTSYVRNDMAVRRLTPIECERLQDFPDNYTRIAWRGKDPEDCPDGPRYKALGNSMAVPVMRWIGERIQMIHLKVN